MKAGDVAGDQSTPRSRFRSQRRDQVTETRFDLEVDGWDGLYVRYAPVGPVDVREYAEQRATADDGNRQERRARARVRGATAASDAGIGLEITVLARHCQGLFWLTDDVEASFDEEDPDKAWPRFDQRTLSIFGLEGDTAEAAIRCVYGNAADAKTAEWRIVQTADLLIDMSKRSTAQARKASQGG